MKDFTQLFTELDQTTKTNAKVEALVRYFERVDDKDKLWAMGIFSHRRPKRTLSTRQLREWAAESSNIPLWLFEASYHVVGDLSETIALLTPSSKHNYDLSLTDTIDFIKSLSKLDDDTKREKITEVWQSLNSKERFIFNKLITGGFRIGVSQKLMSRALSQYTQIPENNLAHRLMGQWTPDNTTFDELILSKNPLDDISKPYPFYLAYALEGEPESLGTPEQWQAERKWDGIRGQIIIRNEELFVWSRGEELVTDKYPEYHILARSLPSGTVLDGEILPFKYGKPLPFSVLQTRIGRKTVGKKLLESAPVIFMVYDLLEWEGKDFRETPLSLRRNQLEALLSQEQNIAHSVLRLSEKVDFNNWDVLRKERSLSRKYRSEGLMLKRKESTYGNGRKKGDWWKWKVDPLTIDAVMIYAMRGHGRRANLYTDYTFAVWDNGQLVPFAKAYSGLTDKEIKEVDRYVKQHTIERFGPVRSVQPDLVFELAFEGLNVSSRHKSGVALRFPRIKRWRRDKPAKEANTLADLKALMVDDSIPEKI